jgi:hypothetical protein
VFDKCQRTIFEFQHYVYDEWSRNQEFKNPKEKPKDKDDHLMEAIYRLAITNPIYVGPETSRPIKNFDVTDTPDFGDI